MSESANNKPIPFGEEGIPYYIIKDEEKGVAFDYAKNTYPLTYVNGSRALTLNSKKDYIISTSGTSKSSAWWKLININDAPPTSIEEAYDASTEKVRKVMRDNHLVIQAHGKEYTPTGVRLK